MNHISFLRNPIMNYEWGSRAVIADLLGEPNPADRPEAELWMGAHPKAPSQVLVQGQWKPLDKMLEEDPEGILGPGPAKTFAKRLPFLFKVLAAEKPLSIQVHPNQEQAIKGYAREFDRGIPLDGAHRNYSDPHHKSELLCALHPFVALKGFRPPKDILEVLDPIPSALVSERLEPLRRRQDSQGLKEFWSGVMGMDRALQARFVEETVTWATKRASPKAALWMVRLQEEFPGDMGVISPLLLNLICLEPGEAIYVPAGELHSYLHGTAMEIMASSDNVLRGGLTSKHVDPQEFLAIACFEPTVPEVIRPVPGSPGEKLYPTPAQEFVLSEIVVGPEAPFMSPSLRAVEILFCAEGELILRGSRENKGLLLCKGKSVAGPGLG